MKKAKKTIKHKPKTNNLSAFLNPIENSLHIKCEAYEPDLMPEVQENYLKVKAIVDGLNTSFKQEKEINFRQVCSFKTLIKIDVPKGFKLNACCNKNFTLKGLYVTNCSFDENGYLLVSVTNLGPLSPITVVHKEYFIDVFFEPIHYIKLN